MHSAMIKSPRTSGSSPNRTPLPPRLSVGEEELSPIVTFDSLNKEVDFLRKEKIESIYKMEYQKKRVTYAIMFGIFGFVTAICMVVWKFAEFEPSYEQQRQKV